mmetsp:Transcript_15938/g.37599  ORF Transcript_15938/g.37599 Transcript_15938/m.37599 type:complete len:125 (+) Transcript_15938:2412-2786(+)
MLYPSQVTHVVSHGAALATTVQAPPPMARQAACASLRVEEGVCVHNAPNVTLLICAPSRQVRSGRLVEVEVLVLLLDKEEELVLDKVVRIEVGLDCVEDVRGASAPSTRPGSNVRAKRRPAAVL